jgi:hypothetical protein
LKLQAIARSPDRGEFGLTGTLKKLEHETVLAMSSDDIHNPDALDPQGEATKEQTTEEDPAIAEAPTEAEPAPERESAPETDASEAIAAATAAEDEADTDTDHEPPAEPESVPTEEAIAAQWGDRIAQLEAQHRALQEEIAQLQDSRTQLLQDQLAQTQGAMGRLIQESLSELEQRKHNLQITVEQLERRQERIREEMKTSFAGVSQDLAIRVQGFKEYLVGSLQDLATAAEQLELSQAPNWQGQRSAPPSPTPEPPERIAAPKFAKQRFQDRVKQIRQLLDQYRTMPDYYGPAWQLRRTFEPIHADRLSDWFFVQGGRGAIRTMGSRLQNILIASAAMSVLKTLYGNRFRTLILANSPERLGEWRRGLQDCLGISRGDFGPERGVILFEEPEVLAQRADRLVKQGQLPFIAIDETENSISLALLQFPLWLAFAPDPEMPGGQF